MLINSKAFAIYLISGVFCVLLSTLTYKFLWTFSFPRIFFLHWQLWYNATFERYARLILVFFFTRFFMKKKRIRDRSLIKILCPDKRYFEMSCFWRKQKIILSLTALICTWRNYTFKQFALVSSGLNSWKKSKIC